MRTAGAETAEAILFCHDDQELDAERLRPILEALPHALIMVRVFDRRQMIALDGLGIPLIQREVFESAVVMGRSALSRLGIAEREVTRVEREYRLRDSERLQMQSESGDLHAGSDRSFGAERSLPDEPLKEAS